ncbi:hypothetical protein MFLO_07727 [Listeria floridensis FSL S10-1187]|uniref:Methyltransferase n=1 Tax=Listeria floridensis FSL S10-1187 TaxID=1265817 RepID=A0ABP3AYC6_9LIST|nr:16S rRNA (guanine(966)-N(2))-methyltransferase RsmD [Listeria floridensis]EUJ32057.1 hypothetical protein MFLO_07727 [Listeria floridensis FSL S10-1187]
MRVIAGSRKGHSLKAVPGKNTRPTTDKIKEALFSIIGPYFDGERVLDLFAGSGGLGIEALSRGAKSAVFIDQAGAAIKTVNENIRATHFETEAQIFRNEAKKALKLLHKNEHQFDLVFLDPPYKKQQIEQLMTELAELELLSSGAVVVCEHDKEAEIASDMSGYKQIKQAVYGITVLSIYQYGV